MEFPINWQKRENSLFREFVFPGFKEALAFINKVGVISEESNHHPDISLSSCCYVQIQLRTHDEGGVITEKDFDLAKAINGLLKNS